MNALYNHMELLFPTWRRLFVIAIVGFAWPHLIIALSIYNNGGNPLTAFGVAP